MEDFEEMKLYWNQLAEKNNVNSEINKKILESIKKNRYESLTGKMKKERVIGLIFIVAVMIFIQLDKYHHILAAPPMNDINFCMIEGIGLFGFLMTFLEILFFDKLDFSMDVTKLRGKISNYKKYVVYSYRIFVPILSTILLGSMIYMGDIQLQYTAVKITFVVTILITLCILYLCYKTEMKRIKRLEEFTDDEEE
ncbi:MAG: hypothetical protein J5735_06490 [Prevotella sp.]|nr:hypothetical protein [Prevotella sp.]